MGSRGEGQVHVFMNDFEQWYDFEKILKQDDSENILKKVLKEPIELDDNIKMSDDEDL